MSIPTVGLVSQIDFLNPACFTPGGTGVTDLSGNGNNWTFQTNAYTYNSTYGTIFFPAGSSCTLTCPKFLFGTTPFTFSYWFVHDYADPINSNFLLGSYYGGSNYVNSIEQTNGFQGFYFGGNAYLGPNWAQTPNNSLLDLQYNHVCATYDGSTVQVYLNNVNTNTLTGISINLSGPEPALFNEFYGGTYRLKGLGLVNIYEEALTAGEVTQLYNDGLTRFFPPPTPTVEYDFQNGSYSGSGTTVLDLQGGDTNLTIGNAHWVAGTPNYFDLQGDTSIANTNPGSGFSSTTFTVNCWYNPLYTNPGTYASVWGLGKDGNPTSPILSTNSDGTLNIQWSFGYGLVGTTVTNDWHLISFVSNGSTTTLYVDGISIGSNASSSGTVASPYTIRLGSSSNSSNNPWQYAYGKIGYWSYFDVALDAGQVLDLYNATSGSYITPIAQYDFSDTNTWTGTGNTAYDLSPYNNDLTLSNGPLLTGTGTSKTLELRRASAQTARKSTALNGITDIPMTFNIWSKVNPATNSQALMSYGIVGDSTIPGIWSKFFNEFISFEGGFSNPVISSGITANNTDFYNIIVSINPSTATLYVNGTNVGTSNHTISLPAGSQFSLSGLFGTNLYDTNADIGLVEVYNVALGSTQVTDLYNSQVGRFSTSPPTSNGVGGRQFAQGFNG